MANAFMMMFLVVGVVIYAPAILASEAGIAQVSRPFEYSGYSASEYKGYDKSSHYVSMSDGTKLAVDVYLPVEGPTRGPFPALFNYHPYRRATIDPVTGKIETIRPGMQRFINFFTSYGYAVVIADMRGSGASFGSRMDVSPPLAWDGKQLIDWMETQPWSDGSVGMFGASYEGWSQLAVAAQKPRALKAIMPELIGFDAFSGGMFYRGGIYPRGATEGMAEFIKLLDLAAILPALPNLPDAPGLLPAAPVVDEDGDGQLADEIPLDLNNDNFFYNDPPTYSDGAKRQHIFYKAVREHLNNINIAQMPEGAPFRNSRIADTQYTWTDISPGDWPVRLGESGIAVYHVGAWFDVFPLGTARWYATLKATNPSKMLIHPSNHTMLGIAPELAGPYWKYFGEDIQQVAEGMFKEKLRFFDRYLKGIKNGIDSEPPLYIYVMNGPGWRQENEWPLARQVVSSYYFDDSNRLSGSRTTAGSDTYAADFTHDSRYGKHKATRNGSPLLRDEPMMRTDKDRQCLTYTSAPLEQDVEITGHPIVRFWVSSTADYGDFFVYLEDVDEEGEAYYVTEGKLRAGFAGLVPQEEMLPPGAGIDVLPDLPYHGFNDHDFVDRIFASGNIVELVIDLLPTSWVFKEGHRSRVSIASADWPTYELHPRLSPNNDPSDAANTVPKITIYRDSKHPSRIELPIVPALPKGMVAK